MQTTQLCFQFAACANLIQNLHNVYTKLKETLPEDYLLPPVPVDVTKGETTLAQAVENADAVVSLVGILYGSLAQFEAIQWKGAENIARAAAAVGAKLVRRGRTSMEKYRIRGQKRRVKKPSALC